MEGSFHEEERMFAEQIGDRTGVAALEKLLLVLENEPVRVQIGRENRRLAEEVGREDRAEPAHPVVDERLRVLRLVGGDQLEGLADEGEAESPRREAEAPESGRPAEEEEEENGGQEEEEEDGHEGLGLGLELGKWVSEKIRLWF